MSFFSPRHALVTGASSGLGALIAERLAARGASLVLVARRRDRLDDLAERLRETYGVECLALDADLSVPGAGRDLWARLDGRAPDTLVNAAGFGTWGTFAEQDADRMANEITLNVSTLVELTRAALPPMIASGSGTIVNVASIVSFQPMPGMAVYGASKSFVREFSEAIAYETHGSGVRVLALCPGSTATEFFDVAGHNTVAGGMASPVDVVDQLMRALDRRHPPTTLVTGLGNAIGAMASRLLPRRIVIGVAASAIGYDRQAAMASTNRSSSSSEPDAVTARTTTSSTTAE